jgi:hypothetical protein
MTTLENNKTSVYRLGRVDFCLKGATLAFTNQMDILLPQSSAKTWESIDISGRNDLRTLQNILLKRHDDCMWLDAGCLIAPGGKKVLIIGRSGTGKSTTTMALALAYRWKVIAEDILLIDLSKNELITFGAPFSLKKGTLNLLLDCIGTAPEPILEEEWSPLGTMADFSGEVPHFDFGFIFSPRNEANQALEVRSISHTQYLKEALPFSNILRMKDAADKFLEYIRLAETFKLEGGTLRERLDLILECCG